MEIQCRTVCEEHTGRYRLRRDIRVDSCEFRPQGKVGICQPGRERWVMVSAARLASVKV